MYARTINASAASKLKELIIGNSTPGYDNPHLTALTTGANYMLEKMNIENVSGLTDPLNLSLLDNLREVYAKGSSVGGVTFADGGRIEIAELPAISAATLKNLSDLVRFDIAGLSNLTSITVENCGTVDTATILSAAPNLNRVRVTGVDWSLENTDLLKRLYNMAGFDKDGYNSKQSVLTGVVRVAVIRQQEQLQYAEAWPELEIIPNTIIEQFPVTFMNANGEILEVQYVDKGEDAVDPTTRSENPVVPTIESSVSHDFTFSGWDSSLLDVFSERTVTALYSESLRKYTVKYVSMGAVLQETVSEYGTTVTYEGSAPTYTVEENAFVYYLFNRWDKSGYVDGNKTVSAVFDRFAYTSTSFDGKELADLSPVEIYAMNKLDLSERVLSEKDLFTFTIGNDVNYDDIESSLLISEKTHFDGTNHIDTGIKLFDEDKDFVLVIDYEFLGGNVANDVLAQCYSDSLTSGFKLWYGSGNDFSGVKFTWGGSSQNIIETNKREVLVIRHKKGDNNLTIYKSNMDGTEVTQSLLTRPSTTANTSSLVFGASNPEEGYYENKAIGNIYWAKIWFTDIGDDLCKSLATWTHESITLEVCGFRKYYLTDNPARRCSFTLLATHLLSKTKQWNTTNTNEGGWAESALNRFLNTRLFDAMPTQIKLLTKKVKIKSSVGKMSTTGISESDCYITIPALIEVDSTKTSDPYGSEGTAISYMTTNESRQRTFANGDAGAYWTRSPSIGSWATDYYVNSVQQTGAIQPINAPTSNLGVLIELSF